jgi:fructan beta-fructosidase
MSNVDRRVEVHAAEFKFGEAKTAFTPSRPTLKRLYTCALLFCAAALLSHSALAEAREMNITQRYLNIPIGRETTMRVFQISVGGNLGREFPAQLAEGTIDYWVFIDVSEFKGQVINLSGPASQAALNRIYQDDKIEGSASLYKERDRPRFHFTVKRGWSNDVNGPIFYKGQYHMFWQAFPFGVKWDTGFMYWGHAISDDLIHWRELAPALMVDKLGSPWSGSSFVDRNNDGGWGKDALVLVYTAFDRTSHKQVQCIAYSTNGGVTFARIAGNPVLDSNSEQGTNDTRDPKVFWNEPTRHWVMVLFEKDGMTFYTSTDLKSWTRQSHFSGLFECPDFFELPVDGDRSHLKWILHGGSASYFTGSFDGRTFTPESPKLSYAEGKNANGEDILYAAQSFADMPDGRRVQIAWGRIKQENMPFNQMMLFPTEFRLTATSEGLRLRATPIKEIERLHQKAHSWSGLTAVEANKRFQSIRSGFLHVKLHATLKTGAELRIRYQGTELTSIQFGDLEDGRVSVELLIDKSVAEIFVNDGARYIIRELPVATTAHGLEVETGRQGTILDTVEAFELKSMWNRSQ